MIKQFTKVSEQPQRQPRSHDSTPGAAEIYAPGTYHDYTHVGPDYPANHPDYSHQTDQFNSSLPEGMGRGLSREQQFQLLSRKYNMTREQFDLFMKQASKDKIPGGLADNLSSDDFDKDLLDEGIDEELEHTSDRGIATEIAMDHLTEDLQYYRKLKKMKQANLVEEIIERIKGTETVDEVLKDQSETDSVKIEVKDLGNGALAETLPDGTILIDENIEDVDDFVASRLVHELAHYVDWQDENYLDRPEEKNAFEMQVQFLLEKGYGRMDIEEMLLPIFNDYKDAPEAKETLKNMIDKGLQNLKASKTSKVAQVGLTFSAEEKAILDKIEAAAEKLGIKAFLAGGIIRDRLLGIESSDLDFVFNKDSERLAEYLVKQYGLSPAVKMDRSGATMIYMDGKYLDLIDAKKVFSLVGQKDVPSLEQDEEAEHAIFLDDSMRRDLSINSLMYGLHSNKLYDPTGKGLADIQSKTIRTIIPSEHKYRISPADMLRAIRFYATKPDFQFAPGMLEAMKLNVHRLRPRQEHGDVSSRRIERELRKAKSDEEWAKMKGVLSEIGANEYIGDEIKAVDDDIKGEIEYGFDKPAKLKSFTKTSSDFAGRPLPDTNALPQEQTFTYPYPDGDRVDKNYNAGNTLKQKEIERETEKKKQRILNLLKQTKDQAF